MHLRCFASSFVRSGGAGVVESGPLGETGAASHKLLMFAIFWRFNYEWVWHGFKAILFIFIFFCSFFFLSSSSSVGFMPIVWGYAVQK